MTAGANVCLASIHGIAAKRGKANARQSGAVNKSNAQHCSTARYQLFAGEAGNLTAFWSGVPAVNSTRFSQKASRSEARSRFITGYALSASQASDLTISAA